MSAADTIFTNWSEADKKKIKATSQLTLASALTRLKDSSDLNAVGLACVYYGVLKTTTDDGDQGKLKIAMNQFFGKSLGLKKTWFDGMGKAVSRLRQQANSGLGDVRSVTDIDVDSPFAELVTKTCKGIKFVNKTKPTLFRTSEGVARIRRLPEANLVQVQRIDRDTFASELESRLAFYREDGEGRRVSEIAPKEAVRNLHTRAHELPIPYLDGLVRCPVFGKGGLISEAGYHASENLYYEPASGLVIPEVPNTITDADLKEARRLIVEEWLGDFPFDGWTRTELEAAALGGDVNNPPPASLLNAIGAALVPLVRPLIRGAVPMTLIDKPSPRTGASMLAGQLQTVLDGSSAMQAWAKSGEEREKRILGALKSAASFIVYDNVAGKIDCKHLAMILTAGKYKGRPLGTSEEIELPARKSFAMTGNNPHFTPELAERINRVRLDARMERPGNRDGWRHANLDTWVLKNRGKLLWALMVMVRNWMQKDKPQPAELVKWGAFNDCVRVVGGIIHAAGDNWTTWQANRESLIDESDEDDDAFKQLLAAWWESGNRALTYNAKKGVCLSGLIMADEIELDVRRRNGGEQFEYNSGAMGKFLAQQTDRVFNVAEYLGKDAPFEVELEKGKHTKDGTQWIIKESKMQRVNGPRAGNVIEMKGDASDATVTASDASGGRKRRGGPYVTPTAADALKSANRAKSGAVLSIVNPATGEVLKGGRARALHKELMQAQKNA